MQDLYHQKLAISFTLLKFVLFILNVLILLNIFLSPTQFTTLKKMLSFGSERANTLANLAHISRTNKTELLWGQTNGIESFLRVLMFDICVIKIRRTSRLFDSDQKRRGNVLSSLDEVIIGDLGIRAFDSALGTALFIQGHK